MKAALHSANTYLNLCYHLLNIVNIKIMSQNFFSKLHSVPLKSIIIKLALSS